MISQRNFWLSVLGLFTVLIAALLQQQGRDLLHFLSQSSSGSFQEYNQVVGIEFGTTNSRIGIIEDGELKVIPDAKGRHEIASCVAFTEDGKLIGHEALQQASSNPQNTVCDFRYLMGQTFSAAKTPDAKAADRSDKATYSIVDSNGKAAIEVTVNGSPQQYLPEEIAAMVLRRLKRSAEAYLGKGFRNAPAAAIAVPAYFNDVQRQATRDAANRAGFNVLRIVNESTAACIAHKIDQLDEEDDGSSNTYNILVYDVGVQHSEVTLMNVDRGVYEIFATNGDRRLTGKYIDALESAADSRGFSVQTYIGHSREVLRRRALRPISLALVEAEMEIKQIDILVLTGNRNHVTHTQPLLEEYFTGKKIYNATSDLAVLHGAALQGAFLASRSSENPEMVSVAHDILKE